VTPRLSDVSRMLLDHAPAVAFVTDRDGKLVFLNDAARRSGGAAADLVGRTLYDLLPPGEAARARDDDRRILANRQPLQFEGTYLADGGTRVWFTLKFPITDECGEVVGIGNISTDVTEARRDESELKSSQEAFAKVFRASTIAITLTSVLDGRLLEGNPACETLTGYRREEMIGRSANELGLWVTPADRDRAVEILKRDGSVSGFQTAMRDRAGVVHDVLMSLELIELGGQRCILTLTHDITEMKRLQQRLEQAQRLEALGRLAGGVAHDFNNLLTAIQGYAELAVDETPEGSRLRGCIEHVQRAARRAGALTEQLLVFGRQQVRPSAVVDVNATITALTAMLTRLIGEDVRLETSLSPAIGAVAVDPAQLEQVVLNLALNARDAMPSGGRLRIATAPSVDGDARSVVVSVTDDGVGMDEATRARIFEPFFTTKAVGKGTGLGLATVYGIVEQAGGRIAVASEPGRGARFDVILPEAMRARSVAPLGGVAVAPAIGRQETLLIVEDDESVCEFVCLVLSEARYKILSAPDGEAALRLASEHKGAVDLLVTDIVMPNRNGRSLANVLRRDMPSLRVMYMSGYPGDTIQRYDDIPAGDTFLQKPFTRETLLRSVADALRR
jgi:two-component system, cell cycle sensor histidine kinase and response regulator CckA